MTDVIVAIFVACTTSLLYCVDLPYFENLHTFNDPNTCKIFVEDVIKEEGDYRIKYGYTYNVVMGKCIPWCKTCRKKMPVTK